MNKTTRLLIALVVVAAAGLAFFSREARHAPPAGPATSTASQGLPRLVDLGAGRCIQCKMMKPILDDLKANYTNHFSTQFIDVWENPDAGTRHGVEIIPTQIFFDARGRELFRHTGFFGKEEILGKWKELGVDVTKPE